MRYNLRSLRAPSVPNNETIVSVATRCELVDSDCSRLLVSPVRDPAQGHSLQLTEMTSLPVPSDSSSSGWRQHVSASQPAILRRRPPVQTVSSEDEDDNEVEEFINQGVTYLWFALSGNNTVKKADFIKAILPESKNLYNQVIVKIQEHMKLVFGTTLIGFNEQTQQTSLDLRNRQFPTLTMSNTLNTMHLLKKHVFLDGFFGQSGAENLARENAVRSLLFLYLGFIFMKGLDIGVDEETTWEIMHNMRLDEILSVKQVDFRKFLKAEFVTPLYLSFSETKDDQGISVTFRYFWGVRSHLEYSKFDVFTRVVMMLPGNKEPVDFPAQMQYFQDSGEKDRALESLNASKSLASQHFRAAFQSSDDLSVSHSLPDEASDACSD